MCKWGYEEGQPAKESSLPGKNRGETLGGPNVTFGTLGMLYRKKNCAKREKEERRERRAWGRVKNE